MILADTSIWVDHFRRGCPELAERLDGGLIICHPFVIGELACGNLRNRDEILSLLAALPAATVADHDEAMDLVSEGNLHGQGLGWIEVHLLAASLLTRCSLWTRDKALAAAARSLGVTV